MATTSLGGILAGPSPDGGRRAGAARRPLKLDWNGRRRVMPVIEVAGRIAASMGRRRPDWSADLVGAARLGLCVAAARHQRMRAEGRRPTVPFRVAAIAEIRKHVRRERAFLAGGPRNFSDLDAIPDVPGDDGPRVADAPTWLEDAWRSIPPRDRRIVHRRLRGDSWAEIGEATGLTAPGAHGGYTRAIEALRKSERSWRQSHQREDVRD